MSGAGWLHVHMQSGATLSTHVDDVHIKLEEGELTALRTKNSSVVLAWVDIERIEAVTFAPDYHGVREEDAKISALSALLDGGEGGDGS